jgi:DNA-binding LacI/PurR family transcriptional regulator
MGSVTDSGILLGKLGPRIKEAAGRVSRKDIGAAIEAAIMDTIRGAGLPAGTALPGNAALAKAAGISHITLRKTLEKLEDNGVLEQIQGRGTFLKKSFEAEIKVDGTVAVLLPYLKGGYHDILDGAGSVLSAAGLRICVSTVEWSSPEPFREALASFTDIRDLAGVIRSPSIYPARLAGEISFFQDVSKSAPVVFADRPVNIPELSSVGFDDNKGVRLAFDYLWGKGFRNIYFVLPPYPRVNMRNAERSEAFLEVAAERGVDKADEKIIFLPSHLKDNDLSEKVIAHYIAKDKAAAFLCGNDMAAFYVSEILEKLKIEPARALVTGYDATLPELRVKHKFPTVERNRRELGVKAAEILLRQIRLRQMCRKGTENILITPIFTEK